jgi:hypothetical protein
MTSRSSGKPDPVDFDQFALALAERRRALGEPELPRNSGKRRTSSKRALLKAIEDAGGKW